MPSRNLSVGTLIFTTAILISLQEFHARTEKNKLPTTGAIALQVVNQACRYLIPQSAAHRRTLTDFQLNESERTALGEGCILQATAMAPNGMRLTDVPLLLLRAESGADTVEQVERAQRSNDIGTATWHIDLTPHTAFEYHVVSPAPTKISLLSNRVDIVLCTGLASSSLAPASERTDVGRGCRPIS